MRAASPALLRSFRTTEVASNDLPQSSTSRFVKRLASSCRVTTQGRVASASSSQSVPVECILITADKGFTVLFFVEILVAVVLSVAVIAVFVRVVLFLVEVFMLT
jgi:hypothetical protein